MKHTKKDLEQYLNGFGVPFDDKKSNGGRIPDNCKYGSWMRKNDPIAFHVEMRYFKDVVKECSK